MPRPDPLRFHGDQETGAGLADHAVNVRLPRPPAWLADRIRTSLDDLGAYPDATPARTAVAARHGRPTSEVLVTAGAAEAFVLLARALRPKRAVCVHPSFTEPEAALTAAGVPTERLVLAPPFRLDPALVPSDADLVVVGNPTNPTSVSHPAATIAALTRPGRTLIVDEAFADFVPGEPDSVAARRDLPGLVVVRSLTKMWGLAGLRVGYLLGPAPLVDACAAAQPAWSVSTPALVAAEACSSSVAVAEADAAAVRLGAATTRVAARYAELPGIEVVPPDGPFLLLHVLGVEGGGTALRQRLRELGFAVRRCDTFPGLTGDWLRVAVRDNEDDEHLLAAVAAALAELSPIPVPASPAVPVRQEIR